jgi:RimJ/RimL family protein N-acetyltransferase
MSDSVVSLAPFELADTVTVMKWDADPDVQHWYDWPRTPAWNDPATCEARRANAERTVRDQAGSWAAGKQFAFIIHAADTGEGLGWIDLQPRGQGRGNVAAKYAFEVLGWARLEICANADNTASRRVAVNAGFELEGVLRSWGVFEKYEPLVGQRFDWAIYARLR